MTEQTQVTEIWSLYDKGKEHHNSVGMYEQCEKFYDFYEGNQWRGAETGGEELPVFNFIKPTGKYKISMIAQNNMSIVYSAMGNDENTARICDLLNAFAAAQWEKIKMDTLTWQVIKRAFITGDHYLYCFNDSKPIQSVVDDITPQLKMRSIDKTNIYLADEQNPVLDEQEWIIIAERIPVLKAREIAKANKIKQSDIDMIVSDDETDTQLGVDKNKEVKSNLGKCTSLLYMHKTAQGIEYCRSVKNVIYVPKQVIAGLDMYPVVGMRWEEKVNDARGLSGVKHMIPNQLQVNKTAARRAQAVKMFSLPKLAYDSEKIANVDDLSSVGAHIEITDMVSNSVDSVIKYLNPAQLSPDAEKLQAETLNTTRELEGAGDAATGQIDPTQASGEAIRAARDQSAVPLNEQIANYKQFIEDIALLWFKLWVVYTPANGLTINAKVDGEEVKEEIPKEMLSALEINVKIDVSPTDPYSKVAQDMELFKTLQGGFIGFDEYVQALGDDSNIPKAKLQAIIDAREKINAAMPAMPNMPNMQTNIDMEGNTVEMQEM